MSDSLWPHESHAARQASLSITSDRSSLRLTSIESVMPSSHLPMNRSTPGLPVHHQLPEFTQTHVHLVGDANLCCPLLLLPPVAPSIRVFSNESILHIQWPKYWSFSFSITPPNEFSGLISFRMDWFDLLAVSRAFSNTTVQKNQFFGSQPSLWSKTPIHTWLLEKPQLWLDRPLSAK